MKPVPILYLDLDGTVRHCQDEVCEFVNKKKDVHVYPEAVKLMKKYKSKGWRIVAISNQGGVALGHMTFEDCSKTMMETQRQCKGLFDKMVFCVHHPEATEKEMSVCWCRKPRIGMVVEAARSLAEQYPDEYYPPHMALFVGDRQEDEDCARNANIKFMQAEGWRTKTPWFD